MIPAVWEIRPSGDPELPWRIARRGEVCTSALHAPDCADVDTLQRATWILQRVREGIPLAHVIDRWLPAFDRSLAGH